MIPLPAKIRRETGPKPVSRRKFFLQAVPSGSATRRRGSVPGKSNSSFRRNGTRHRQASRSRPKEYSSTASPLVIFRFVTTPTTQKTVLFMIYSFPQNYSVDFSTRNTAQPTGRRMRAENSPRSCSAPWQMAQAGGQTAESRKTSQHPNMQSALSA